MGSCSAVPIEIIRIGRNWGSLDEESVDQRSLCLRMEWINESEVGGGGGGGRRDEGRVIRC